MKCLLIFGKKFGKDNQPLIDLGEKIKELGHKVTFAHWDDEAFDSELLESEIIIGHSFGGDLAVTISKVNGIQVKFLGLIDPVAQWFPFKFENYWKKFVIPANVKRADCFTRAFNVIPPAGTLKNTNENYRAYTGIFSDHASMPSNPKVVETILSGIKELK